MNEDVFTDEDVNEELTFARRDYQRHIKIIQCVAFHDTFDKYRGLLSFTLGHSEYALQLIKTISHFNGFMKILNSIDKKNLEQFNEQYFLLEKHLEEFSELISKELQSIDLKNEINIKPSGNLVQPFNQIKFELIYIIDNFVITEKHLLLNEINNLKME